MHSEGQAYVLITPARNEAAFVELTIQSVIAQTVRPLKWVIVNDGSTDGTDDIIKRYATAHPWIQLLDMPERRERHFSGKVNAFKAGYECVLTLDFDFVASLDADISFDENYFAFLLRKLKDEPELGLVGTPFQENGGVIYDYRFVSIEHVSGACQFFRRRCFEQIGGYVPVKDGGIDYIAVVAARMKGWKTRTFTEIVCTHHRTMGTAQSGAIVARYKNGAKDYALGHHPVWEFFRSVYQMSRPPYVLGGAALLVGFAVALAQRAERPVSEDFMRFVRREQMARLRSFVAGRLMLRKAVLQPSE
ncbi:MAG: glycosyltransferase [Bryobacteraceae bacterium]